MSVSINVNVNLYSASSQKNTPLMRSMCRVLFKEERIQHASSAWINIGNGKCYSSCWVRQLPENTQASGPCADNPWCSEPSPNSVGFEDYYCAKFHVIPIRGFRFIVLTYTPTHTHTVWQSDRTIHAAVLRRRYRLGPAEENRRVFDVGRLSWTWRRRRGLVLPGFSASSLCRRTGSATVRDSVASVGRSTSSFCRSTLPTLSVAYGCASDGPRHPTKDFDVRSKNVTTSTTTTTAASWKSPITRLCR